MKILISNESQNAHKWIRHGWANSFNFAGHEAKVWNMWEEPAFDVFNKFEPQLYISQTYNLNDDVIKCIDRRPGLKVICKAPDFGPLSNEVRKKYPILYIDQEQLDRLKRLKDRTGKPNFLFIHYPEDRLEETHGMWKNHGFEVISLLNAGDVIQYANPTFNDKLSCDIGFVSGFWPYKAKVLEPYLVSLCSDFSYNIKIFGNSNWSVPQYCGFLPDGLEKDFFFSSKINLNLSEPHSQEYHYDVTEKFGKLGVAGAFFLSDRVDGLHKLLPQIPMANSPEEMRDLIDYYLDRPEERKEIALSVQRDVLRSHTYFHRAKQILNLFNFECPKLDQIITKLGG